MCSCLFELLALCIYTYITTFTATDQCEVTCFLLFGSCVSNPSCLLSCLHRSIDTNLFLVQFIWFIHNDKSKLCPLPTLLFHFIENELVEKILYIRKRVLKRV
jgi:hypothetical protein